LNSERKVNSVLIKLQNMKEFRSRIDIERNELIYKLVLDIGKEKGCLVTLIFFKESIDCRRILVRLILTKLKIKTQGFGKILVLGVRDERILSVDIVVPSPCFLF
jgi:hypothetical protein